MMSSHSSDRFGRLGLYVFIALTLLCLMPSLGVDGVQTITRIVSYDGCKTWWTHKDYNNGQCYSSVDITNEPGDDQRFFLSADGAWVYVITYPTGVACANDTMKQIKRVPTGMCLWDYDSYSGNPPHLDTWFLQFSAFSRDINASLTLPWEETGMTFPQSFQNNSNWYEVQQFVDHSTHRPSTTCETVVNGNYTNDNYTSFIHLGCLGGAYGAYCANVGENRNLLTSVDFDTNGAACAVPQQAQFHYRTGCQGGALTTCPSNSSSIPSMPTLTIGYTEYTSDATQTCNTTYADEQISMYWLNLACVISYNSYLGYESSSKYYCDSGTFHWNNYYHLGCSDSSVQSSGSSSVNTCSGNRIYSCQTLPPYAVLPIASSTGTSGGDTGGSNTNVPPSPKSSSSSTGSGIASSAQLTQLVFNWGIWSISAIIALYFSNN